MKGMKKNNIIPSTNIDRLILVFIIGICIIPIIFFKEQEIQNDELLGTLANYFIDIFPNIENGANIGEKNDIYYFIKLQMFFTLVAFFINLLFSLYTITKIYLCSLNYISYDKDFFSNEISKNGTVLSSIYEYIFLFLIVLSGFDLYFTGIFFIMSENVFYITQVLYTSKILMLIYSVIISYALSSTLVTVIVEGIAQIRKLLLRKIK